MDGIDKLYNALSAQFDLGTATDFRTKIADKTHRRKLYDAVSKKFDLGVENYEAFSAKVDSYLQPQAQQTISFAPFAAIQGQSMPSFRQQMSARGVGLGDDGLTDEARKRLPQGYMVLNEKEQKKAEQKAIEEQRSKGVYFTSRESQLSELNPMDLMRQRVDSNNRIRSAKPKTPDELFSVALESWQQTNEGIRRSAQYERDIQAAITQFQDSKQQEFSEDKNVKAILQKAKAGIIKKEQAEKQLQAIWEKSMAMK